MVGSIHPFGASKMCWYVRTYFIKKSADGYGHSTWLLSALVTVGGLHSSNLKLQWILGMRLDEQSIPRPCPAFCHLYMVQKSGSVFSAAMESWVELGNETG